MSTHRDYFETLYETADPFGYRDRWYEARKRAVLLASLPQPCFRHGWEMGCSNGVLTADLARRCERLLATDVSASAVASARAHLTRFRHVNVERATHPQDWPDDQFDLIVMSEVGYYFDVPTLRRVVENLATSLTPDGVLVACHWLKPFAQAPSHGEAVHDIVSATFGRASVRYNDDDVRLEVWDRSGTSVAQQEGLR